VIGMIEAGRFRSRRASLLCLGLSILRDIVEGLAGRVEIADRPGGGALIQLEFAAESLGLNSV